MSTSEDPINNNTTTTTTNNNNTTTDNNEDVLVIKLFGEHIDVSSWLGRHPGGRKLLNMFRDRDASQQFAAIHKGERERERE